MSEKKSKYGSMIDLLQQVGEVHHKIRPDLFRSGAQKYNEADLEELLKDENRPVFVGIEDGRMLGYCFCIHKDYAGDPVLADRKELYIDDLCVEESCRGQGVAGALYRHVLDYGKGIGCGFVTLNVWQGNEGAMKFYEAMGMNARSITMETKLC